MGRTAKWWRAIGMGLLPLCVVACTAAYVAPPPGDTASVDIIDQGTGHVTVDTYKDATNCSGRSELADLSGGEHKTTAVTPGKEFALLLTYVNMAGTCNLLFSFLPDQGKSYRVYTGLEREQCHVRVLQPLGNGRGEGPVPIRRLVHGAPIFSPGVCHVE